MRDVSCAVIFLDLSYHEKKMPEDQKNTEYWQKRRKNNEAARRSREKRKMNDVLLEKKVSILTEENKRLKAILLQFRMKFGELGDMYTPLSNPIALTRDFYDISKYDDDSSDGSSPDLSSMTNRPTDLIDSGNASRLFTSKVFTNASGDTSATVHVNKLPGSSHLHGTKFSFQDIPVSHNDSLGINGSDLSRDLSTSSRHRIQQFPRDRTRDRIIDSLHHTSALTGRDMYIPTLGRNDRLSDDNIFRMSLGASRHVNEKEENTAALLAEKYDSDVVKNLSFSKQSPLIPFNNHIPRHKMATNSNLNGNLVPPLTVIPPLSLPMETFFKNFKGKTRKTSMESEYSTRSSAQVSSSPSTSLQSIVVAVETPSSPNSVKKESHPKEVAAASSLRSTENSSPVGGKARRLDSEEASVEGGNQSPPTSHYQNDESHKTVQLPHKLRLKKTCKT